METRGDATVTLHIDASGRFALHAKTRFSIKREPTSWPMFIGTYTRNADGTYTAHADRSGIFFRREFSFRRDAGDLLTDDPGLFGIGGTIRLARASYSVDDAAFKAAASSESK